jgi:hypothetical protein
MAKVNFAKGFRRFNFTTDQEANKPDRVLCEKCLRRSGDCHCCPQCSTLDKRVRGCLHKCCTNCKRIKGACHCA